MPTYVFSRSQPPGERDGLTFINESPEALITRLRRQPGKNIFLMGGGELAREFLKADLIDEVSLSIVPVLLGEGLRYFRAVFRNAISFSLKTARSRRDCVASSTNGCGASYERFGLGRSGTCPMVRLRFCNLLMLLAARPGAQVIKLY